MTDSLNLPGVVLQVRPAKKTWFKDKVVPACTAAGLVVRAFEGSRKGHIYAVITAPLSRLLREAETRNYQVLLDRKALREADETANRILAARGISFDPSGRGRKVEDVNVCIPPLPPSRHSRICPCLRSQQLDPYDYIFAPYRSHIRHLYVTQAETGSPLTRTDALKLLKEAIEAPADVDNRGAGLNLERLRVRGKITAHYVVHDSDNVDELERKWDVNAARRYLGEETALYFAFVSFIASWLVVPAIVGVGLFAHQVVAGTPSTGWLPVYGIFVSVWATLLQEVRLSS